MIIILIALMIFLSILLGFMASEAKQDNLIEHTFHFKNFPEQVDKFRIFFISDIHRRRVTEQMIRQAVGRADCVVIGGDLMEKGVSFSRVEENINRLRSIAPVYFIWGNHDHNCDEATLKSLLAKKQVQILENESNQPISGLSIIGVDDSTHGRDDLEQALNHSDRRDLRVLISHNPNIKDKLMSHHKISLILSGHTHGGQIRLFGWGIREKGGIKESSNGILVISNGYGTTRYHLRLGARPDCWLITLRG